MSKDELTKREIERIRKAQEFPEEIKVPTKFSSLGASGDPKTEETKRLVDEYYDTLGQAFDDKKYTLGASGDPKGEAGASKPGLSNISPVAQFYEGAVMEKGAVKYGAYNWADHYMKASTYYNAILRHLNQWWLGEDIDPDSGLPHMAHLRASTGIILDQQAADRMIDDRPKHLAKLAPVFLKIEKAKKPMLSKE